MILERYFADPYNCCKDECNEELIANARCDTETNSTIDDRERRKAQRCFYCKPNRGENAGRRATHGEQKPRYKDH